MEPQSELGPRVGAFFIVVGSGLMLIFVASALSNRPSFGYFFLSLVVLFFGFLMRRRPAPRPTSGRFGAIHRARERRRLRQEQKKERESKR